MDESWGPRPTRTVRTHAHTTVVLRFVLWCLRLMEEHDSHLHVLSLIGAALGVSSSAPTPDAATHYTPPW